MAQRECVGFRRSTPLRARPLATLLALVTALGGSALTACVGPTTPLGAVDEPFVAASAPPAAAPTTDVTRERPRIVLDPPVQRVHGPYTLRATVTDPGRARPAPEQVHVFYNGEEVSRAARLQFRAEYRPGAEQAPPALVLSFPQLRLGVLEDHHIELTYDAADGATVAVLHPFPAAPQLADQEPVASTDPFDASPEVLAAIEEAGRALGVNTALLAALIAQESSFDPYALSKARALGLTQVTHLAEADIVRNFQDWPRYPGISRLSRRKLRRLIPSAINGSNEWRLDPVKSVWGGAYYLAHLQRRLATEDNLALVRLAGGNAEQVAVEASLAAYNSGLNRVLYMLSKHGPAWLDQRATREAKRYVRKILSYYGTFREADGAGSGGSST